MLLNLHTHLLKKQADEQIIFNLMIPESAEALESFCLESSDAWLSVGIHPWYISEANYKLQLQKVIELASHKEVKLIGECGLDRLKGVALPLQEEVFINHIRIAEEVHKPIVIHCVKCYSELLSIKKVIRPKIPMVIHGFNNKVEVARQLLEKEFYLSLGTSLLHEGSNAITVLEEIPLERLFLETGDKEVDIKEIYQKVAEVRNITMEEVEKLIFDNYLSLY